jgi:2'-5' RNA ligase
VIPVSDEVHNFVSKIQMEVVRTCGTGPRFHGTPHITLKLSFRTAAIEPFEPHLDRLAAEVEPFEIRVGNIDFFDPGIMFLDVEPNSALEHLRRRILRELSDGYAVTPYDIEGDRFHFHVTVAYDLSPSTFAHARRVFAGATDHLGFVPGSLALLCHTGEQWFTYKRAGLARRQHGSRTGDERAG